MKRLLILSALAASLLAQGPAPAPVTITSQPEVQAMGNAARAARRTATALSADLLAQADKLIADSANAPIGEQRRKMAGALTILAGKPWDAKQEFVWSIALRPTKIVYDSALPLLATLTQFYPTTYRPTGTIRIMASLVPAGEAAVPIPLGTFEIPARDLIDKPFSFDGTTTAADGAYQLRAQIMDPDGTSVAIERPIQLARGIETSAAAVEAKLAKIKGRDGAKASVLYPYQMARVVNVGQRAMTAGDFGGHWDTKRLPFDFAQSMKMSADVLKALEAGKDPLTRAKGDHVRHYWFEDAKEPMAYRVYAPMKWDGKSKLPMVLVLHGNSRDQDYYFDRDDNILAKLAEKHGYLVATPMGYRPSAGWGSSTLRAANAPPMTAAQQRTAELSEKDALNVLDMVTKEYGVDTSRIYLFGHSAGAAGTWYMAQKYPEKWVAIGASAAATNSVGFPFERLKGIPMMVFHGSEDNEVPIARSRNMVAALKERGFDPIYHEVKGATHGTIVAIAEPLVFEFFDKNPRKVAVIGVK